MVSQRRLLFLLLYQYLLSLDGLIFRLSVI